MIKPFNHNQVKSAYIPIFQNEEKDIIFKEELEKKFGQTWAEDIEILKANMKED